MNTSLDLLDDDNAKSALGGLYDKSELSDPNPATKVAPTEKQIRFAHKIAQRGNILLPWNILQDRKELSIWIDQNIHILQRRGSSQGAMPSSKQVQFAERIAKRKRLCVPDICFKDKQTMSQWIDRYR